MIWVLTGVCDDAWSLCVLTRAVWPDVDDFNVVCLGAVGKYPGNAYQLVRVRLCPQRDSWSEHTGVSGTEVETNNESQPVACIEAQLAKSIHELIRWHCGSWECDAAIDQAEAKWWRLTT